jgi:hypothetical protein
MTYSPFSTCALVEVKTHDQELGLGKEGGPSLHLVQERLGADKPLLLGEPGILSGQALLPLDGVHAGRHLGQRPRAEVLFDRAAVPPV